MEKLTPETADLRDVYNYIHDGEEKEWWSSLYLLRSGDMLKRKQLGTEKTATTTTLSLFKHLQKPDANRKLTTPQDNLQAKCNQVESQANAAFQITGYKRAV